MVLTERQHAISSSSCSQWCPFATHYSIGSSRAWDPVAENGEPHDDPIPSQARADQRSWGEPEELVWPCTIEDTAPGRRQWWDSCAGSRFGIGTLARGAVLGSHGSGVCGDVRSHESRKYGEICRSGEANRIRQRKGKWVARVGCRAAVRSRCTRDRGEGGWK
jgi:hypothetical protein